MNNVIYADNRTLLPTYSDNFFDAIITDPEYKGTVDLETWLRICKGNILAFCDPLRRYFKPDAVHHWCKPISTKNTSKQMSRFVEEILVLRRGETFNADGQWANRAGYRLDIVEESCFTPIKSRLRLFAG